MLHRLLEAAIAHSHVDLLRYECVEGRELGFARVLHDIHGYWITLSIQVMQCDQDAAAGVRSRARSKEHDIVHVVPGVVRFQVDAKLRCRPVRVHELAVDDSHASC